MKCAFMRHARAHVQVRILCLKLYIKALCACACASECIYVQYRDVVILKGFTHTKLQKLKEGM